MATLTVTWLPEASQAYLFCRVIGCLIHQHLAAPPLCIEEYVPAVPNDNINLLGYPG